LVSGILFYSILARLDSCKRSRSLAQNLVDEDWPYVNRVLQIAFFSDTGDYIQLHLPRNKIHPAAINGLFIIIGLEK